MNDNQTTGHTMPIRSLFCQGVLTVLAVLFLQIFFLSNGYAKDQTLTLELQHAPLPETIRLFANSLHINVMTSATIHGEVNLHFDHADPWNAFSILLTSYGLDKWRLGNVWYVAPRDELIKQKQEELKWQEMQEASTPFVAQLWRIKYAKAEDMARIIQGAQGGLLSKSGHLYADTRTNSIYIQDVIPRIKQVGQLIERLDVPIQQIAIYVRLASVDDDVERELGVHFGVEPVNPGEHGQELNSVVQEAGHYSLALMKLANDSLLDVKLSALESAGHAELISSPRLFTANQQPASIEAGEEVPYQETSDSGGTAIVFKKAVLGLKVTPQVLPGNKVMLQLQINQDRPGSKMVLGMPTISTRQITTSVLIRNGQTIVLGGIYETNKENAERRMPFISQMPVIGMLFKQHSNRENKRELLIFVTPKIIT